MTSKIEKIYAFVTKDKDNNEKVIIHDSCNLWMPLLVETEEKVKNLVSYLEENKIEFKIIQFDNRTDVTKEFIKEG